MKLGIVILYWKNKDSTQKLLQKLISWCIDGVVIVLVENECNQDVFPEIDDRSLIKVCSSDNLGFGAGVNAGISALNKYNTDFVLLLNTDIEVEKKVVIKLCNYLKYNPQTFAVGPKIIETYKDETNTYIGGQNIAKHLNTRIKENDIALINADIIEVDYVIGAVLLMNKQLLKNIGQFDEDFFFSGEVAELCYRARQKRYKCETVLTVDAYHQMENSLLRQTLYKYYNFRNRFLFMRKHPSEKKYLVKWCLFLFKELLFQMMKLNLQGIKTMLLIISHVLLRIRGNQNHRFI